MTFGSLSSVFAGVRRNGNESVDTQSDETFGQTQRR